MSKKNQIDAGPAATPSPAKSEEAEGKPKKEASCDPFILEKMFADPIGSLKNPALSVSIMARDCLFVLDANALIDLYKVGESSVTEISEKLETLQQQKRLFFPKRALREFIKNRSNALKILYDAIHKKKSEGPSYESLKFPMLEACDEYKKMREAYEAFHKSRNAYMASLTALQERSIDWSWNDPVSNKLVNLIEAGNVIEPDLKEAEILEDNSARFRHKRPPGYKDGAKADEGVGDLIIWHSILKLGKARKKSIIFVTNETKTDWAVRSQEVPIIARAELCSEYFSATGENFGITSLSRFLKLNQISTKTVGEVEKVEEKAPIHPTGDLEYQVDMVLASLEAMFMLDPPFNQDVLAELCDQLLDLSIAFSKGYHRLRMVKNIWKHCNEIYSINDMLVKCDPKDPASKSISSNLAITVHKFRLEVEEYNLWG